MRSVLAGGFVLLLSFSVSASATNLKFSRTNYPIGGHPVLVQTGDFNNDGKPDVITANFVVGGATFSVLLGNGDGTLQSPKYTVATYISWFALGDFNRDGKLDLAYVWSYDGNFTTILLGNGDGTFQAGSNFTVSGPPGRIVAADFNGDGKLDLATADGSANLVSVLLGNGDGSFQPAKDCATDYPFTLATGDFNNDGKIDLIAGGGYAAVIDLLLGNGDGTFQSAIALSSGRVPPVLLQPADLDNDGNLDIAFVAFGNAPTGVLLGNGDGTFQPEIDSAGPSQFGLASYALADFFNDGKLDFAATSELISTVDLLFGMGNGHFHLGQKVFVSGQPAALAVAAADLNGDHLADLVVSNQAGKLTVLLNQGPQ